MKRKGIGPKALRLAQRPGGVTVRSLAEVTGCPASVAWYTLNELFLAGELTREPGRVPAVRSPGGRPWIYFYRWNGDDVGGGGLDGR